mmetsp:Transcript_13695/g.21463  ORF Transcript_13695/g.21463 Transcript_13695/m.21463 type:complete len:144 (+) Transcript_13695:27-458(+)
MTMSQVIKVAALVAATATSAAQMEPLSGEVPVAELVGEIKLDQGILPRVQASEDEDDMPISLEDEEYEPVKHTYSDDEKETFIYGVPGTPEYDSHKSAQQVIELEEMWRIDKVIQQLRGAVQGWHRGFYSFNSFEISPTCFSK